MLPKITIRDEASSGQESNKFTLDCFTEQMTIRELIRARIYQEVQDYNLARPEHFKGLVQPTQARCTPSGYKIDGRLTIDWQEQYEHALEAFHHNGFFLLVGDKQPESLDETFEITVNTTATFIKLVPLVGG